MSSGVKVGVRIRPLLAKERHQGISFNAYDSTSCDFKGQTFTFDHVFSMELSQQELYNETAAPMLKSFLEGYNVTVIAYGQTGSGKTFSMGTSDIEDVMEDSQGLIPRFVTDLFENLKTGVEGGRLIDSKVMISFLEIYGEDVFDLNGHGERVSLPIREDLTGGRGIFVEGLQSVQVSSAILALDLLCNGTKNRVTGSTQMNSGSSRSHAVYTISLEQTLQSSSSDDDIHQMHSKLTFVDLAGSERLKRTGAEGQRLKEGIQINSGLFNLGQVINCLADDQKLKNGGKPNHIPYRNSKLTHLLKDALGGNSQTLFLACVSPAESNESETLSTLNYARQARNIENKPVVNMDKAQQELRHLKYAVKTWMMKAIAQKFSVRLSSSEFRSNAAALGSMVSPLPCTSPVPSARPGASSTSKIGNSDFNSELSAIMERPDVKEYMNAVNKAINEKLLVGCAPSPRKVRLSLAGELASPYRTPGSKRALQGVAKKLCMPPKTAWEDVPVGGKGHIRQGMQAIREEGGVFSEEEGYKSQGDTKKVLFHNAGTLAARGRGRGRESVLFAAALKGRDGDTDETERLVARMLEMINLEKQMASETITEDDEELDLTVTDDADRELYAEEEEHQQQAKKIVEVDTVIAEKEEILTKLLDTVRGYSAMKSDFERLLDAIGTLESERQNLEAELEKTKRSAESQSLSQSQSPPANNSGVERIKERFLKVKEELRVMREERTKKENAYRLMQRESKQCDIIQKELVKLKESKVSMQRQQRVLGQQMAKLKKEQQSKLTTMKKSDVKKQQQMNLLKGELVKRERILGHKDREISRINTKLKACEDHIAQLLKLQNKNRTRTGTASTPAPSSGFGKASLSPPELEHLLSSKAMLDNLVSDRVEKWKNKALFERKSTALKELNKELEAEAKELDMLMKKKRELYEASGKEEDQDDHDAEDFSLNNTCDANESAEDIEKRAERLAVRMQVRETETTIDGITRDLDLLNTDLEDLAQQLDCKELAACADAVAKGKKTSSSVTSSNWEDIGREIIVDFSLSQCQSLLWEQIGEKASLLEQIRAGQFEQQEAKAEAVSASTMADNVSRQLAFAKADLQSRLHRAERQRVQDVWALLRAQSKEDGVAGAALSEGEASSATRVAIQRAQDLEGELESYISSDDRLTLENEEMAARISYLEAAILKVQLKAQLSRSDDASDKRDSTSKSVWDCFDSLSCVWDSLGVSPEERAKAVHDIQRAGVRARESALSKANHTMSNSQQQTQRLMRNLTLIAASIGQSGDSFYTDESCFASIPSTAKTISEKLQALPLLPRLSAIRNAVDSATAVLTVRSSGLEKLKDRLLDIMSEMWLDKNELSDCLRNVLGVDFVAAATEANHTIEELDDDSADDVDEIATFMVTSALCVAGQLEKNNITLTEANIANWEKEMRSLNVSRAKLTTQMVAMRAETAAMCSALCLDSDSLLALITDGSEPSQAQAAAVELVIAPAVSNPPGSVQLLTSVGAIKKTLENVKSDRSLAAAIASKFSISFNKLFSGDETAEEKNGDISFEKVFASISDTIGKAQSIKDQLVSQLKGLLRQAAGASPEVDDTSEALIISTLLSIKLMQPTPPVVCALERDLTDLETLSRNSRDMWMVDYITRTLSSWGDMHGGMADETSARIMTIQICVLRVEVRRLLRLSETLHDLQRLDGQLVKHISEMEEFEAASKQDRIKLLSGNSKALIEEEKFRKSGKRKYEQITERMIALAGILEQLNTADGSVSPTPGQGGAGVGSVNADFSCLSSQGQALLRGKGHWQERVELMHLHTTTHGTRRWSGAGDKDKDKESSVSPIHCEPELSPKGPGDTTFSGTSSAPRARHQAPAVTSSGATVSANPFAAAANPSTASASLGPAVRPAPTPPSILSHLHVGMSALATRAPTHTKATGSAMVSGGSTTPRGKASAITMNNSITAMNNSLASLSNSQRFLPGSSSSSGKGSNLSSSQRIGNENIGNTR